MLKASPENEGITAFLKLSWNTKWNNLSLKTCLAFILDRIPCLRIYTLFWAERKHNTQSSSRKSSPFIYFGICLLCSFPTMYTETECSVCSTLHICKILASSSLQCQTNSPSFWVSNKLFSSNYLIVMSKQNDWKECLPKKERQKGFLK